jgi:hypothetical protein
MMQPIKLTLTLTLMWLGLSTASAAPFSVECPISLRPEAIQLSTIPDGWHYFPASPIYLHGAAPMSTPPERLGHLIEDAVQTGRGERTLVYSLDGPFPEGKWIQCAYGEHHQLTLSKRLPDHLRRCSITYRQGAKAGERNIRIRCE